MDILERTTLLEVGFDNGLQTGTGHKVFLNQAQLFSFVARVVWIENGSDVLHPATRLNGRIVQFMLLYIYFASSWAFMLDQSHIMRMKYGHEFFGGKAVCFQESQFAWRQDHSYNLRHRYKMSVFIMCAGAGKLPIAISIFMLPAGFLIRRFGESVRRRRSNQRRRNNVILSVSSIYFGVLGSVSI